MDKLLFGGITGAGYLLSKNGKNNRKKNESNNVFKQPSQKSIYETNYIDKNRQHEEILAKNNFKKSVNAINTNVIPPHFNSKITNTENNPINYLQNKSDTYVSELTGNIIKPENISNNQIPFFGSHVRQTTNHDSNNSILSNHTGIEEFSKKKSTPVPLFEPTKDIHITYGTQQDNQELVDRINVSKYRKNELPFQKINVGPNLGSNYSANPSGGFHPDVRPYIIPKGIDDLRPKTNPQISYKGRVVPGKSTVGKSTSKVDIQKNRPDTFYVNSSDRYLTTTGSYLKEKQNPCIIAKDTNRKYSKQVQGSAAPALVINQTKRSLYKKSTKNIYSKDGPRNAYKDGAWTNEEFGDYGKKSHNLPQNERDITGKRSHISNLTTIVKALIAPVVDVLKTTRKENVQGNVRQTGNLGTSQISKHVAWDPTDIAKTTIKETNIHDNRTGNINAETKNVAWDPNDVAKTTIKETNIHDNRTGNINGETKNVAWDPNDVAKTTIKETNIHDTRTGNLRADGKGTVIDKKDMKFRTTIRETLEPETFTTNMKVRSRQTVHDPNDTTRTTIKETNIHDTRTGSLAGPVKLTVYDPNDVAKTTMKQTLIENDRTANIGGISMGSGYLTNKHEAPNTNRQFTSDYEYEGIVIRDKGMGYATNDKEAPNTNRQFTSDHEYEGTADSMYKRPSSYDTAYNARINQVKEGTLVGRQPTGQGSKIFNGKDKINMETKKIQGDSINTRELSTSKIYNSIKELKPCSITQEKNQYDYKIMDERIDPDLLNAFKKNPYTQSLSSYVY